MCIMCNILSIMTTTTRTVAMSSSLSVKKKTIFRVTWFYSIQCYPRNWSNLCLPKNMNIASRAQRLYSIPECFPECTMFMAEWLNKCISVTPMTMYIEYNTIFSTKRYHAVDVCTPLAFNSLPFFSVSVSFPDVYHKHWCVCYVYPNT